MRKPAKKSAKKSRKKSRGRPEYAASSKDRKTVQIMVGCGFTEPQIAQLLEVDPKTLRKYFGVEIRTGKTAASAMVAKSLFQKATGFGPQSVTAAIFWLKTQASWRETSVQQNQFLDKDGNPVDVQPPVINIGFKNGGPGRAVARDPSA